MTRQVARLFLILMTIIFASGPDFVQAQEEAAEKSIELKSDGRSDAAIARRINLIFQELSAFQSVRIAVSAGVVTLSGKVLSSETAAEAERLAGRVDGVVVVRNEISLEDSVEERLLPAFERLQERIDDAYSLAPLLGAAVVMFAVIALLGFWISSLRFPWNRIAPNAFVEDLIRQVLRLAFLSAGLVIALDILGATALLGTILGAAGILGLAVGFALRDTIENYVASIMLSIRQPFRPNDHVRIGEYEGHVIRLTSRATVLMSLDGNHVRIPNAEVFKGVVTNYTRNPERRFEFTLGVDADSNMKHVIDLSRLTLERLEFVLKEPEPLIVIQEVGDSNVVLWFAGWIDQRVTGFAKARSEAIRLTKRALEEAGVMLPEPIYRIRMDTPGQMMTSSPASLPQDGSRKVSATMESPDVGDSSKGSSIAEKVAAERASLPEGDLLDPVARQE